MQSSDCSPIIRAKRALALTGLSRSELYKKSHDPTDDFPAAVRISMHSVGWLESEIIAWRENRQRIVTKVLEAL